MMMPFNETGPVRNQYTRDCSERYRRRLNVIHDLKSITVPVSNGTGFETDQRRAKPFMNLAK